MNPKNRFTAVIMVFGAIGGLVAALNYFEGKRHRETIRRVAELDEKIKQEQLNQIRNASLING